ncbi:MAG: aspartate aminotransferase family protein [Candidatus Poribacteria bacterium]|nr:aspartate aminotransferase family protein [Candidatus Poribacteria bacterium]
MTIQHDGEPRSNAVRKKLDAYVPTGHKTYTPTQAIVTSAEGIWLTTADGKRLLDFTSGVLVANLGHAHPDFEAGYARYAEGVPRNCYNAVSPLEADAAERLIRNMNLPSMEKVLWADSGSAGIIKAIWAAQHTRPDKKIMLATRLGFHGKKGLAGDVTGEVSKNPDVRFIGFPMDEVADVDAVDAAEANRETLLPKFADELDALKREHGDNLLLLITEPYLGAAGSFHPTKWYLQFLNEWCRENEVVFILDEVQSCHGRTGNMYACESYGVEPDIVVLGKGLGNGEPIAATVGRAELLDSFDYGEASDTFSGNPRGCAAVLAALDVYERQPIVEHGRTMAKAMRDGLVALRDEFESVVNVRGEGLVWGVEMSSPEVATAAVLAAYNEDLHLLGPLAKKVLRVSPPLTIQEHELHDGLERMRRALKRVEGSEG